MEHNKKLMLIQEFLSLHNFTEEDFCRIAGITSSTLNKIMHHEHYVCLHDLNKIANILNIDVCNLL